MIMWNFNGTPWTNQISASSPWTLAVALGTVAIVTIVANLLLLLAILLDPLGRSRSFHLHIVNMALVAVLQGAGVLPLWAHHLYQGSWHHGDSACQWWLAADTLVTCVSALTLVVIACDRFIYLLCWRFVKEGGKYVTCCVLMALAWLLALGLTLTLTLLDLQADPDASSNGGKEGCGWDETKRVQVVLARLIVYAVGTGLGVGLSVALASLPCLGMGHVLPIDEDDEEVVRRSSLVRNHWGRPYRTSRQHEEDDEDFPRFALIKKTDRLEERDCWKGQVISLLVVSLAWAVMWLPAHLFVFADLLELGWQIPRVALDVSIILGYAHAAIMPLLWHLHQPIRESVMALLCCRCCRSNGEEDDDSTEFQDIGPYRPTEVFS